MLKKILSMCAAVALISLSVSPASVSADVVDDTYVGGVNTLYRDMLEDTLAQYGLADTALDGTDWYFCGGPYMDKSGNKTGQYCTALWLGGTAYRCTYYGTASVPYSDYYTGGYSFDISGSYVGHVYLAAFYFSVRWDYYLDFFMTDNVDAFNRIDAATTEECFFAEVSSASEIVTAYEDAVLPDPTEPTISGSDGFQLPDSWINGGETLAPAEPVTFESVDMSGALAEIESMEYTTPPDVLGAVGAFWYIFDGFVTATDLMWLVITSLVVVLVAWFLGRRV